MIIIRDYQPTWPEEFESIRASLLDILEPLALQIDHIGSTSVPGLGAKDVIDIQVTVQALTSEVKDRLIQAGYEFWPTIAQDHVPSGEDADPTLWAKFLFNQPKGSRRANVHVRVDGHPNQRYPLLFRDYLRAHPNSARSIERIKREVAKRHADDEEAYYDIKDPVYDLIWEAALEWSRQTGWKPGGIRQAAAPDDTAVRVALWRALHVEVDPPPHVLEDKVGLKLVAPDDGWRSRPDMSPFTRPFRASIVARARVVEDLVAGQAARGVGQYVILGAGLDTFAQRRPEIASRLLVFEIDRPGPQAWKPRRLVDLGLGIPPFLRFVPVDFEAGDAWWERLAVSGFDTRRPAVVASTGVSMYLTKDAIAATLRQIGTLASGSTLAMSFMLPIELANPEVRPGIERAAAGARANGTPFISFFTPTEMLTLARDAGFKEVEHVSAATLAQRYFADRTDGLRPPSNSEELLVART